MATLVNARGAVVALACMGLVVLCGTACFEVQARITYANETASKVMVTVGVGKKLQDQFQLDPGASTSFSDLKQAWPQTVEAKDPEGNVVLSRSYTWEELKSLDFHVVITAQQPEPTSQPPEPTVSATPP